MARTLAELLRSYDVPPQLHDRLARVVYGLGGGRVPFVFTVAAAANLLTNAETAVLTTPAINPPSDQAIVLVLGTIAGIGVGTGGTLMVARMRQGSGLAGGTVGPTWQQTTAVGNTTSATLVALDTPGAVAGLAYTMSGQMLGASANSGVSSGFLIALALG